MGYDPSGCNEWGWEEKAAFATAVIVVGLALLMAPPTGGGSLACGALVLDATVAGSSLAIVGTAILGDAVVAGINEANGKRTSRNQMQRQVERKQAPDEVDRVDPPHTNAPNQQDHIHFKDGTALNADGTISHDGNGIPIITKPIAKWITSNGWKLPQILVK